MINQEFKSLMQRSDGRHLTDLEAERLIKYGKSLRSRLAVMQAIERAEPSILDHVVRGVIRKLPRLRSAAGPAFEEKLRRDTAHVLRYCSFAYALVSTDFLVDKLSVWSRTILCAVADPKNVMLSLELLREGAEEHLTPQQFEGLAPYLDAHIAEFALGLKGVA